MKLFISIIFLLMFCQVQNVSSKDIVKVTAFGAIPDGKTFNTNAIQSSIDKISESGGGTVIFPKGIYLTGSIYLKSGVELHLEKGSVILGSTEPDMYKRADNKKEALIFADNEKNISISGEGAIDGQGRKLALGIDSLYYIGKLDVKYYNTKLKRPEVRPLLICFVNCKDVKIIDIELKNSSSWVQSYDLCENIVLNNLRIHSDAYWNNDGIDIDDCKKVKITNCSVNAADDGICLKSTHSGSCNDSVYIANCRIRSSASAIKFGTDSHGGFRNIKIRDIKVYDTFRSAIALESVDGGILENIEIDGLEAFNTGNAIFLRLGHRNENVGAGILRNISIKNVKVHVPFDRPDKNYEVRGPDLPFFHNPIPSSITGIPGNLIENISLENIEIIFPGRGNNGMAILPLSRLQDVPERENVYPEFSMFGELPAWGFYVRHVKGLTMKNISVSAESPDYRPAFVFDDVKSLNLSEIKIKEDDKGKQLILKNVENANLSVNKQWIRVIGE